MRLPGITLPLALSMLVHGVCIGVVAADWSADADDPPPVDMGDEGDDPPDEPPPGAPDAPDDDAADPDLPFAVSVLPEGWEPAPPPAATPAPTPPAAAPTPPAPKPVASPAPEPRPAATPADTPVADAAPPAEDTEDPPLPPPDPVDPEDQELLQADAEAVPAPEDDDDGEAFEAHRRAVEEERKAARHHGRRVVIHRRPPRVDHRPPCDPPNPAIAQLAEGSWGIERELIDYYATHLRALMELGSVWAHKDPHSGRLDGFRLGLARCSLLRQAGLRSGDVVHDVNGHEIHSVLEAVSAYFALRAERHLELDVSRRGEDLRLKYDIHSRKERRTHRRKR